MVVQPCLSTSPRLQAPHICGQRQPGHVLTLGCAVREQYGPIFVESQIDPAKGGKVTGTRMGRTYELVVSCLAAETPVLHATATGRSACSPLTIAARVWGPFCHTQVPEKCMEETAVIRLQVTNFDGHAPPTFRLGGRIVSNKVQAEWAGERANVPWL